MSWTHGASGYKNYGCRCEICRKGWAARQKVYLQRRKARTGERILHGMFVPSRSDSSEEEQ